MERTAQLEDARTFSENIVDTVREPILILDGELHVEAANRSFYQVFHVSSDETLGHLLYELGDGQWDIPELRKLLEDILPNQSTVEGYEVAHCFPSIGERVMRLNARRLRQATRRAPLILLAIEDVTEIRHAEEERARLWQSGQEARRAAEDANAAKDQFIAVISHEIRNMLSPIVMAAQVLRHEIPEGSRAARSLTTIERNASVTARLVNDLLDLARARRGELDLETSPLDLSGLVENIAQSQRERAEQARLTLHVSTAPGLCVSADPDRVEQIVLNLLTNAIKFTPEGGEVRVALRKEDGSAHLVVEDTGIGMDERTLSHVFGMFERGRASQGKPGLGIGLALVKSITEAHGGHVWAESEGIGKGSRFTVELPLVAPGADAAHPHGDDNAPTSSPAE